MWTRHRPPPGRRNEARDTYDLTFVREVRVLEDLCRLAGEDALADRVRPSTSRPGRTEQDPPVSEDGGEVPAAEDLSQSEAATGDSGGENPAEDPSEAEAGTHDGGEETTA